MQKKEKEKMPVQVLTLHPLYTLKSKLRNENDRFSIVVNEIQTKGEVDGEEA